MNEIFDFSCFVSNGEIKLRNQRVENCRIIIKEAQDINYVKIVNCIFKNVIIQGHMKDGIVIEHSTFLDCRLQGKIHSDSSRDGVIALIGNAFTDCFFEGVSVEEIHEQSEVTDCYFWECMFQNISIKGDIGVVNCFFCRGMMDNISYLGRLVEENKFFYMKMRNIEAGTAARYNGLEKITLQNVKLTGKNEQNDILDCDTEGFIFSEDNKW